jgi:hypothetical protein
MRLRKWNLKMTMMTMRVYMKRRYRVGCRMMILGGNMEGKVRRVLLVRGRGKWRKGMGIGFDIDIFGKIVILSFG